MRAAIIEDHELVRDSLRRILIDGSGFTEVLEAPDLDTGLEILAAADDVALIVVDLNLPGSSGPEALSALVEAFPQSKVLVVSASEAKEDVIASLSAGVDGYAPKSLPVPELLDAIREVMSGKVFVPRALTRRGGISTAPRAPAPASSPGAARPVASPAAVEHLTPRQREVLDQLVLGRSSREIARVLNVAEGTVKIHVAAICRALGVRTRAQAVAKLMAQPG